MDLSSDEDPSESLSKLNQITHRVASMASIQEKQDQLSEARKFFVKVMEEYQKKSEKQYFSLVDVINKAFQRVNAKTNLIIKNL